MAVHLESELGVPVNVVNATGGKGVTGHNRGLRSRPDGYTITMITSELNMMHWTGLTKLDYRECRPLMSINEDAAALFVRQDAPWATLGELENEIRREPGKLTASGTASGGSWHLALAGWLMAGGINVEDVTWISSTGAAPSLQELISGGIDMVSCSLPEARTLIAAKQVRALGVMALKRIEGYEDVATFTEQGTDWSLYGWRGLGVPAGTPGEIADRLVAAIERVVSGNSSVAGQTFPQFMAAEGYDHTWRPPDEFGRFLEETDAALGTLLTHESMKSVNVDPIHPMTFPNLLFAALGVTTVGLLVRRIIVGRGEPAAAPAPNQRPSRRGMLFFALFAMAISLYPLLSETVGFVLLTGAVLLLLLSALGTRLLTGIAITVLFTPLVYQLFANVLRVPLPHGWWGW
jgi:tripartite-type tricarboxylate transporter receptor subunit TctC